MNKLFKLKQLRFPDLWMHLSSEMIHYERFWVASDYYTLVLSFGRTISLNHLSFLVPVNTHQSVTLQKKGSCPDNQCHCAGRGILNFTHFLNQIKIKRL